MDQYPRENNGESWVIFGLNLGCNVFVAFTNQSSVRYVQSLLLVDQHVLYFNCQYFVINYSSLLLDSLYLQIRLSPLRWRLQCCRFIRQECIPVGCVQAAHWPYPGGGGCLLQGVSALGGSVCSGGVSAPRVGVSAPGGVSALGGVCSWEYLLPGGCVCSRGSVGGCLLRGCLLWGVSAPGGVVSQHTLRQTPPTTPC